MGSVKFTTAMFTDVAAYVNLMARQQRTVDIGYSNGQIRVQIGAYRRELMAGQVYNIASRDGVNPDWLAGFLMSTDNVLALDNVGIAMIDEDYARDMLQTMAVVLFESSFFRQNEWFSWTGAEINHLTTGQLYAHMVCNLLELCHFGTREFYETRGDRVLQIVVPSGMRDLVPEHSGCSPEWFLMAIQKLVSPELRFHDVDLLDAAVHQDFGNASLDGLASRKWDACDAGFMVSFSIFLFIIICFCC